MKLRFRDNSLRLRVNRREVEALASGARLSHDVCFPGDTLFRYILESSAQPFPSASFENGTIKVSAPGELIRQWQGSDSIGIYFELPANGTHLKIAIEKDLECIDTPLEERDPDAFPRSKNC